MLGKIFTKQTQSGNSSESLNEECELSRTWSGGVRRKQMVDEQMIDGKKIMKQKESETVFCTSACVCLCLFGGTIASVLSAVDDEGRGGSWFTFPWCREMAASCTTAQK